jgi:hypothetical protein
MDAKELLYYGFGQVIYSISLIDGRIQREEVDTMRSILEKAHKENQIEMDVASIIFTLQNSENSFTSKESFEFGIKNMKLGDQYLTKQIFENFCEILQKIADSYPPATNEERDTIQLFKNQFKQFYN